MLPDFDRVDRKLRAVLVGVLRDQVGGDARASGVGFRFLLELSKIERQSECTSDVARG